MGAMGQIIILFVVLVGTAISAWVTALRMRRRAKKALGRGIKGGELTSINTWMKVEEAEKRRPLDQ
jgi:hypothetical protein